MSSAKDSLTDMLRELVSASLPGLVTQDDLRDLEGRLDEITDLVGEIEQRLEQRNSAD